MFPPMGPSDASARRGRVQWRRDWCGVMHSPSVIYVTACDIVSKARRGLAEPSRDIDKWKRDTW